MIISNSSPLILLARINKLGIIKEIYKKIYIPKAVYNEVIVRGKEEKYSDAFIIERAVDDFIFIRDLKEKNLRESKKLNDVIGIGESEAITLAIQERASLLLIDNLEPRKIAEVKNIKCRSTPGIILEALHREKITVEEYKNSIIKLAEYAWLSGDIVAYFLEQTNKSRRKK